MSKDIRRIPVFVVLGPRTLLLDIAGPLEVLRRANAEQDGVHFDVQYIGPVATIPSSIGLTLADIAPLPPELPADAFVIVPGSIDSVGPGERPSVRTFGDAERQIVAWLKRAVAPETMLISICSGALLSARAGLLDGHSCTTHHTFCDELAELAPKARVLENRLYVEDGPRLTSAGVTTGTDLMLHMVSQLAGPACAVNIARTLVVYLRRGGADPQLSPWLEGRNHIHPVVHRVQDAINAEPARAWSLKSLAASAHASPRHLSRLFNQHTGMSLADYINRVRVALADELLKQTRLDMERIAERAGFASPRQLRRAWSRYHDTSPSQARA